MSEYTNEQLIELGRKTLETREAQKVYDRLYNARIKWVNQQLIDSYNELADQSYNQLVLASKEMSLSELVQVDHECRGLSATSTELHV